VNTDFDYHEKQRVDTKGAEDPSATDSTTLRATVST